MVPTAARGLVNPSATASRALSTASCAVSEVGIEPAISRTEPSHCARGASAMSGSFAPPVVPLGAANEPFTDTWPQADCTCGRLAIVFRDCASKAAEVESDAGRTAMTSVFACANAGAARA